MSNSKKDIYKFIRGKYLLTMNEQKELINNALLVIKGNKILDVGKFDELAERYSGIEGENFDYPNGLIMPGLISNHTHIFQSLMRGIGCNLPLEEWVLKVIFPLSKKMGRKECYDAARLNMVEMISTGTTCFADSHYINHINDNIGGIADALEEIGMRGLLIRATQNMKFHEDVPSEMIETTFEAYDRSKKFIEKYNKKLNGRMRAGVEAICELDCDEKTIKMLYKLSETYDTRFQMHVAETFQELSIIRDSKRKGIIEYLNDLGVLSDRTMLIHSIWINSKEKILMTEKKVNISHNPVSNMILGDGISPIPDLLALGVNVGIGVDGAASNNSQDMFEALKICALLHRVNNLDSSLLSAYDVLKMGTINSAKSLGWDDEIGSIEIGKKADVIIIKTNSISMTPDVAPVENLVFSANGRDVDTVFIDGKLIMKDRKFRDIDVKEVIKNANKSAKMMLSEISF